jgi:hypothetical protein
MEDKLQSECFLWHWNNIPHERKRLFHVNQKAKNAIEGNKMKAMGVIAGVSDMIYLLPGGKMIFIEMKTETGVQSKEQKEFQSMVTGLGFDYFICRSFEEFKKIILHKKPAT